MDSTSDCKHTHPVAALISQEIAAKGVITFARFMELALYHPEHGYYYRSKNNTGKTGDFYTSVSVGSLFGEMLAFWLRGHRQIVEAGANDGQLAVDILGALGKEVEYWIVEPCPELRQRQGHTLRAFGNVKWAAGLDELPSIRGAIISNELLDAFPVHVYRWREGLWKEIGVGEGFAWREMNCDLRLGIEEHLPEGFTMELSHAAEAWWEKAAGKLENGLMLAIDYGDEATELWKRTAGTLRAFRNHQQVKDVLACAGEQDITASVNFTRIRQAGERAGLVSEKVVSQATFLSRIAGEYFRDSMNAKKVRQFQTLTHPEYLGTAFKVLVQRRQ